MMGTGELVAELHFRGTPTNYQNFILYPVTVAHPIPYLEDRQVSQNSDPHRSKIDGLS